MTVKLVGGDYEYSDSLFVPASTFASDTGLTLVSLEILELNARYEIEPDLTKSITGATLGSKTIKQVFTIVFASKRIDETITNFNAYNLFTSRFIYVNPQDYTWNEVGDTNVTANDSVYPCVLRSFEVTNGYKKQITLELESFLAV